MRIIGGFRPVLVGLALSATVAVGAPASADTTDLTIKLPACRGCKVTAVHSVHPDWNSIDDSAIWSRAAKVRKGVAKFRVPSSETRGMSFEIYAGKYDAGNAVPMVALHYAGEPVGSKVGRLESAQAKRASFCWAGTTRPRATLRLRSERIVDRSVRRGTPGRYVIRLWASPTVATLRNDLNMTRTFRGGLGIQQGPYCFDSGSNAALAGGARVPDGG